MTDERYLLPAPARGIFFATERDPGSTAYTTAELVAFDGVPRADLLKQALAQVYAENEALRAVFTTGPADTADDTGVAAPGHAIFWRALSPREHLDRICLLQEVELDQDEGAAQDADQAIHTWASQRLGRPLDVLNGAGVDSALVSLGGRYWFYHAVHHLLADGFAAYELLRRLFAIYRALERGEMLATQQRANLADLAQQDTDEVPLAREHTRAYRDYLDTLDWEQDPTLEQGQRQPGDRFSVRYRLPLSPELQERYRRYGQQVGASWPQLMVAALGSYLGRAQRLDHFRALVPQMNRLLPGRSARPCAKTACTAVNLLPVLCPARGQAADMVRVVQEGLSFNARNALAPYEELEAVAASYGARLGGAQINVIPFDDYLDCGKAGAGQVINVAAGPVPHLTLTVRGMPHRNRPLALEVDINRVLVQAEAAGDFAERLVSWLDRWVLAAAGGQSIDELSLATDSEQSQLDLFQGERKDYSYRPLAAVFEERARTVPEALALVEAPSYEADGQGEAGQAVQEPRQLTYGQFRRWSLALAASLEQQGVGAGTRVAVRGGRSLEFMVAVYALLYLGAVYVPLEPSLPPARVQSMCEDAGVGLVLDTASGVAPLADLEGQGLSQPRELAGLELSGSSPLYVLFTSGSTGKPKGVEVSAQALYNRLAWQQELLGLRAGELVLHKTPISFDVHVWELYWGPTQGAKTLLCAPGGHRDPVYLAGLMTDYAVDVLHFAPSMLAALVASSRARDLLAAGPCPRAIICSGEALDAQLVDSVQGLTAARVHNFYGPTEAAIDVTAYSMEPGQVPAVIPIGRPVANTVVSVRDAVGQPCPPLVTGELYLHGIQVSSGYLNRPEATAQAFSQDERLGPTYATGDLVQWGMDGNLYYRGRADHQIKIRGQRVELSEIETVLAASIGVQRSCVLYRKQGAGENLIAFVQGEPGLSREGLIQAVRSQAEQKLSSYMVPSIWVVLDELPLTLNGKIDRAALSALEVEAEAGEEDLPQSMTLERYCRVFSEILGQPAGPDTDFFASGGHSLLALSLVEALGKEFGRDFSLMSVLRNPTPASLAAAADDSGQDDYRPVLTLREGGGAPIIFLPPAGGLSWCYSSLLTLLPADRPVLALQAENYSGAQQPEATSVSDLAGRYRELLLRQVAGRGTAVSGLEGATLVGWSLGGMVAQELAHQLEARGLNLERVLLLDSYPQSHWRSLPPATEYDRWLAVARMGGLELPEEQLTENGVRAALRESRSALAALPEEMLGVCLEQIQQAMNLIRQGDPQMISTPLVLFSAQASQEAGLNPADWGPFASSLQVTTVSGAHTDLVNATKVAAVFRQVWP